MNSKQLTQQLEALLTEWRKSNPDHLDVCRVIECLASEVDNMDTLGHFDVMVDKQISGMTVQVRKDVSANAVILDTLTELCNQLEDMKSERELEVEAAAERFDLRRDEERTLGFDDLLSSRAGVFRMMGLL